MNRPNQQQQQQPSSPISKFGSTTTTTTTNNNNNANFIRSSNNNNNSSSSSTSQQQKLQQQKRKEQIPMIARFVWAFRSQVIALKKHRAQGILLIQDELRDFWSRSSEAYRIQLRQKRREQRRRFLIDVDRIIKGAVNSGRSICIDELESRRELFLDHVMARMADAVRREVHGRRLLEAQQEDEREKLLDLLLANVPRDVVPGTFEYDEFQDRCHILKLENFQRNMLITFSIGPRADFAQEWENNVRNTIRVEELEERIDMLRQSRNVIAELEMMEIERAEEALRPEIEHERDIAFSGMMQHRALTSMFLLLGPGAGSEHNTRIELILDEEAQAEYLFNKMWEERTVILTSGLLAEEQTARNSRRGVPAFEQHEWCQIVSQLYRLRFLLLQGEFSANDGLYVSSEAGSRRAIRWEEQRARDRIHQSAAATIYVALVPIEEQRARDSIMRAERDQLGLMLQQVPGYLERVLEPGARRGIFRDWMAFARATTLGMFSITLQAIEESRRSFIRSASVVEAEHAAGLEYLVFLEMKHRSLITKQMSSRSIVTASLALLLSSSSSPSSPSSRQQQHHQDPTRSTTTHRLSLYNHSSPSNYNNNSYYERIDDEEDGDVNYNQNQNYYYSPASKSNSRLPAVAALQQSSSSSPMNAAGDIKNTNNNNHNSDRMPPSVALAAAGFPSYSSPYRR